MGFDCTLHLIDPRSFERFAAHFLGTDVGGHAAFEASYDAPQLYRTVREAIARDPEEGSQAVLQLALFFASTETPHLPSRGFALGLWDRLGIGPLPGSLQSPLSLRPLLAPLVEAYPSLEPHLLTGITGNHTVGHYVPPEDVPALLRHVEDVSPRVAQSRQRELEPLLRVLRVVRDRGLAYWEATDLAVSSAHEEWLTEPEPAAAPQRRAAPDRVTLPLPRAELRAAVGDRLLLSSAEANRSVVLDAVRGEIVAELPESFHAADVNEAGRVVARTIERDARFFEVDLERGSIRPLPRRDDTWVDAHRLIGDRVLIAPPFYADGPLHGRDPAWLRDGELVAIDVPPADPNERVRWDAGCFDALPLEDGAWILLWGQRLFHVDASDTVTPLASGDAHGPAAPMRAPDRDGGVLWIDRGTVVRVGIDGSRQILEPALDCVIELREGPDRTLVLKMLDCPEGDLIRIVWLDERRVTRVSAAALGSRDLPYAVCFVPTRRALALIHWPEPSTEVRLLPWSDLEAMPRCSFEELAEVRRESVAAEAARRMAGLVSRIDAAPAPKHFDEPCFLMKDDIVVHPERGRGIVTRAPLGSADIDVTFRDGTVATLPRPS